MRLRLRSITYLAPLIHQFDFVHPLGASLPAFTAGGHVDVHLSGGMIRQYSLSNDPAERHRYVVCVKREDGGRGGSRALFEQLRVGELYEIGEPRNTFGLVEDGSPIVLIAGGIGVTPIRSMALRLAGVGITHEVHYAVRSRDEAIFDFDNGTLHVDDEAGGVLDVARVVAGAAPDAHLYCCGPVPMLDAFEAACAARPAANVHVEHFSPPTTPTDRAGFTVELARSGERIAVPAGSTIIEALRSVGKATVTSCEQGICGTCETAVVSGRPEHRDRLLSEDERAANASMMICCSGSLDPVLVLDL